MKKVPINQRRVNVQNFIVSLDAPPQTKDELLEVALSCLNDLKKLEEKRSKMSAELRDL